MKEFNKHNIKLLNCDCMEVIKNIPDNYYDWLITDPPYGIGAENPSKKNVKVKQSNGSSINIKSKVYKKRSWDLKPPSKEYFDEAIRISKNQFIFGVNYFDYPLIGGRFVWDKLNGYTDQFGCEIAYVSTNNRTDIVYYLWSGMMQGTAASKNVKIALKQKGNKKLNEKRIHPTQKPVLLYDYIYKNYIEEGAKVIDTHHGSGSNAISGHYNNVSEFLGIEDDLVHFLDSIDRVNKETIQIKLF